MGTTPVLAAPPPAPAARRGPSRRPLELFFDLVYVFAITQLSHLLLDDLIGRRRRRTPAFLLLVVWWAWIYTTWMVNWFDPARPRSGPCSPAVMLASLLMAAALPEAFGRHGSAVRRRATSRCRSAATSRPRCCCRASHPLRDVFERLVAGASYPACCGWPARPLDGDQRLLLWLPALALELVAPARRLLAPGRGRAATTDYDIEGGHFAERCQGFIIIALGESIVVTGATAADAGLTPTVRARASPSPSWRPPRCGGCTSAPSPSTRARRWRATKTRAASPATPTPTCTSRSSPGIIATRGRRRPADRPSPRRLHGVGAGDRPRRPGAVPARGGSTSRLACHRHVQPETPLLRRADHRADTDRDTCLDPDAGADHHRTAGRAGALVASATASSMRPGRTYTSNSGATPAVTITLIEHRRAGSEECLRLSWPPVPIP